MKRLGPVVFFAISMTWAAACAPSLETEATSDAAVVSPDGAPIAIGADGATPDAFTVADAADAGSDQAATDAAGDADGDIDAGGEEDAGPDAQIDAGPAMPTLVPPALDGQTVTAALSCTKVSTYCHCTSAGGVLTCLDYAAVKPVTDTVAFDATVKITFASAVQHIQLAQMSNYQPFLDPAKPGFVDTLVSVGDITAAGVAGLANVPTTTRGWFTGNCGCALPAGCTPLQMRLCAFPPLVTAAPVETATTSDVIADAHQFDVDRYNHLSQQQEAHFVGQPGGVVAIALKTVFDNNAISACDQNPSPTTYYRERGATLECTGSVGP